MMVVTNTSFALYGVVSKSSVDSLSLLEESSSEAIRPGFLCRLYDERHLSPAKEKSTPPLQ